LCLHDALIVDIGVESKQAGKWQAGKAGGKAGSAYSQPIQIKETHFR
jgi:hypothetical protein